MTRNSTRSTKGKGRKSLNSPPKEPPPSRAAAIQRKRASTASKSVANKPKLVPRKPKTTATVLPEVEEAPTDPFEVSSNHDANVEERQDEVQNVHVSSPPIIADPKPYKVRIYVKSTVDGHEILPRREEFEDIHSRRLKTTILLNAKKRARNYIGETKREIQRPEYLIAWYGARNIRTQLELRGILE